MSPDVLYFLFMNAFRPSSSPEVTATYTSDGVWMVRVGADGVPSPAKCYSTFAQNEIVKYQLCLLPCHTDANV